MGNRLIINHGMAIKKAGKPIKDIAPYFKADVLITSGTVNSSNNDEPVSGLTYTITTNGDYVIYAMISVDIANDDMKPMALIVYKNPSAGPSPYTGKEAYSETMDFAKKKENQSLQLTYAMDGLVKGDVISIFVNNDNVDIDTIHHGRMLIQSWG